jgi:tetratricopeptide (TPR) repeat protein
MTPEPSWIPGFVALALGIVSGGWLITALAGRREEQGMSDTPAVDLEESAAHAIALLRDLEEQRHRLEPAAYASEKERLERVAADALRQRDQQLAKLKARAKAQPAAVTTAGIPPQLKGFLWGGGTVAGVGLMLLLVNNYSVPRAEGQSMTGNSTIEGGAPPMMGGGGGGGAPGLGPARNFEPDDEMRALAERLKTNENDVDALVRLGHKLLQAQALQEAMLVTEKALSVAPENEEAKVHRAVLRNAIGDPDGALRDLDALLGKTPGLAEAWFFRGMIGMSNNRPELAQESWTKFVAVAPDGPQKERIRGFLEGKGLQMPGQR